MIDFQRGRRYRNKHMTEADFYVVEVTKDYLIGYWLLRHNRKILGAGEDKIKRNRIKPSAWKEVKDDE